ncbi:MAG: DegT/DnrJ/EryC1/StrS family aminotransferase [Bacilli bacterium]|uniref:DegT/DnrJ/EryC1/StrS family aminotransferase n=1 Tax=Anaerorhabdus sp. TaxID=1872524 RepID=UPI002FC9B368
MNVTKIENATTEKIKAIYVVHLYGQIENMIEIIEIAKWQDFFNVEDWGQAQGTEINGKKCGIFGDIDCFSFYTTKNLGGFGFGVGGAIITNIEEYADKIRILRNYSSKTTILL